ncbi:MAG: NADH-quinone oxidoreductase subunit N [Myxococcota bacterium]
MQAFNPGDLWLILPEIVLGVSILTLIVGDLALRDPRWKRWLLTPLALIGLFATAAAVTDLSGALFSGELQPTGAFTNQVAIDPIGTFFKLLFLAVTVVGVLTSLISKELPDRHMGEYYALLLCITFGMFLMASANDLLMIYLGVEMVSIVSYAMAGYRLHDKRSSEAALKYVLFGGVASGLMLFGISLFYGLFGTLELTEINTALSAWTAEQFTASVGVETKIFPLTVLLSLVFIFAGIGYKIAVVPFHMWSPDVYEGAPTPFTGFLSVGPKAAGFALLMRFFIGAFVHPGGESGFMTDSRGFMDLAIDLPLPAMIGIIAAATMTLGNLAAIPQNNVKRLLAYSSIAHAGYLLMGFVVLSESAMHAVVLYLVIYYVMNIGAFTVCAAVRDRTGGESLQDFRGLGSREPMLAVAMVIFLLSLTGLPPLAGFIGKFYLFAAIIEHGGTWYWVLALIAIVNSAISLYYYMRVARAMFFTAPARDEPLRAGAGYLTVTAMLALPVLILGLYWAPLSRSVRESIVFYRSHQPARVAIEPPRMQRDR